METNNEHSYAAPKVSSRRPVLGIPFVMIVFLALLGVPRVILHDVGVIPEGTTLNALFVYLPPLIWVIAIVLKRVPNPFIAALAIGACYGLFLAIGHQLLWDVAYGDNPPQLGGNLAGVDAAWQTALLRFFAFISSLFTGVIVGAISGVVAWFFNLITRPIHKSE